MIPKLTVGAWRVLVLASGFAPRAEAVRWAPGLPSPTLDVTLVRGSSLAGKTLRMEGGGIPSVEVAATLRGTSFGPSGPWHHHFGRSGADGTFRFEGLAPGLYILWTRRGGAGWIGADRVRFQAGCT